VNSAPRIINPEENNTMCGKLFGGGSCLWIIIILVILYCCGCFGGGEIGPNNGF
jgi:hypothetical protein